MTKGIDPWRNQLALILTLLALLMTLPLQSYGAVGRIAGSASVSPTGAANYSIPIHLPRGTNDLAPKLSLVYDHRNGDSLMGMGFAISGLSVIARCSRSIARDAVMEEPGLTTSDSYCLDGSRLQLTSGTQGNAGSTYQTEIETFTRVTANGTAGGGPQSWEVYKSDGLIYEYGATSDSFIEAVGSSTARVWALNKISDRAGNYISFSYTEDTSNGAYRPNAILYTAHTGVTPATKVLFVYESANRPDPLYAYRYGNSTVDGKIHEFKRLDRIDIINNETSGVIRTLDLSYESSGGAGARSRLASIQECAAGDCLAATTFTWINGTPGWNSEINTGVLTPGRKLIMDINGDGRDDVVYASSVTSGAGGWYYMFGTDTGFTAPASTGFANWGSESAYAIEWNGDNLGDILYPCADIPNWCVLISNGNGFYGPIDAGAALNGAANLTLAADVDGDGRHDLVRIITGSLPHRLGLRLRNSWGFDPEVIAWTASSNEVRLTSPFIFTDGGIGAGSSHIRRRDFNGDSREDFTLPVVERSMEPGVPDLSAQYIFYGKGSSISHGRYSGNQSGVPGDFNGDGQADLVQSNCAVRFGRGLGLSSPVAGPACSGLPIVADYDGDGLSDLLMNNGTNWLVSRSTGNGFTAFVNTGLPAQAGTSLIVADINNDGLHDLLSSNSSSGYQLKYSLHAGEYPDLLDRVTDGYGVYVDFSYMRITQSGACYARDPSLPTSPGTPYSGAMYVVCGLHASNGIGGQHGVSFAYYNASYDYSGRGFLGFARKVSRDSRDEVRVVEDFRQDFPFTGLLKATKSLQPDGVTAIEQTTHDYLNHSYSFNGKPRYYPYLRTVTDYKYEVGGAYNAQLLRSSTTTNTVDASTGAVTLSTTTVTEGTTANGLHPGSTFTYSTSIPALFNDFPNWCLGRAETIVQTNSHQLGGGSQLQRTTSQSWDGTLCRVRETVSEPGDPQWQVTTVHMYDAFGNPYATISKPNANQGQADRTNFMIDWGPTGRFPEVVYNPKTQPTRFTWDTALGVRTRARDPNQLDTVWDYDAFGRVRRITRPDKTATDFILGWCPESCRGPQISLRTYLMEVERDTSDVEVTRTYHYLDMFDRESQRVSKVLFGGDSTIRTIYDARGRVSQVSAPYLPADPVWYTTTYYDVINRPTLIQRPVDEADSANGHQTQISYQGLRSVVTNARGYSTQEVRDAIGEIIQAVDQNSADTDYEYDAFGNLLKVVDYYGNATTLTYNNIGLKLSSNDPDLGYWQYSYYPLGELKTQTDAKNNVTTFTYDELSRPLTRVEPLETATSPTGTTTFTYDVGNKAIGKLTSVSAPAMSGAASGYAESYEFDDYGRPFRAHFSADNVTYSYEYRYNIQGTLDTLTYPTSSAGFRLKLRYGYDHGLLKSINDYTADVLGTTYWQAQGMNARGQIILEDYGSGLSSSTGYDRVTGRIESRSTGPSASTSVQDLGYQWDPIGNLIQRQDLRTGSTETFTYDALDRLYTATRNGSLTLTMGYDAIGNITSKTGVGTYTYHATKKHAVVSTSGAVNNSYGYDANGNMSTRNGYTTTWYGNNLPHTINANGSSSRFWYGPHGNRWKQQKTTGSSVETWTYIGPSVERLVTPTANEFRHYINVPTGPVAVYTRSASGTSSIAYLTTDHLGSTDVMTTGAGAQLVNASFNVWGERKGADGVSPPTAAEVTAYKNVTRRGFTFHEQLDELGLVHMNGRVYDPAIGRFMSADPFVQAPYFSQSLNRYSYVFNNPLSFTDPSGFQSADTAVPSRGYSFNFMGMTGDFLPDGLLDTRRERGHMRGVPPSCTPALNRPNCSPFPSRPPLIISPPPIGSGTGSGGGNDGDTRPVLRQNPVAAMPTDQMTTVSTVGGAAGTQVAWASQKGFYVHQSATFDVIGRTLPRRERSILARAQVFADSAQFQDAASSFRHAMRNPNQTVDGARALANGFVRQQFARAWAAPTREDALLEFGIALHTLQDATSPSHAGFQVWSGTETFGEQTRHVRAEMLNPGSGSALHLATGAAWQWFQLGRLPEGDLFIFGHD